MALGWWREAALWLARRRAACAGPVPAHYGPRGSSGRASSILWGRAVSSDRLTWLAGP